jgi:hypothetical protein
VVKDNEIEIDTLMNHMRKVMPPEGLRVALPIVGSITFRHEDIDSLEQYIKN